jgi:hypothetical protein
MRTEAPYTRRPSVSPDAADESVKSQLCLWGASIEDAFNRFHAANPHVYQLLLHFAREVRAAGFEHYSTDALFHRVRWHVDIETSDSDGFKLNDHFTAYYARLLNREPGLRGFFRTRELRQAR